MRIVVLVKNVPDSQGERRIESGRVVRGEDDILNDLDEYAVEAGVQLVEEFGGEVIAMSMGPEGADDALLRALQLGADRAVWVTDDALEGADVLATAAVLGAAIKRESVTEPVDLVLAGMASLDGMTSMVPPAIAEFLGTSVVSVVDKLELQSSGQIRAWRTFDGRAEILDVTLPAVISVTDEVNEPRYPSFKEMKAARNKPMEELSMADLEDYHASHTLTDAKRSEVIDAHKFDRGTQSVIIQDTGEAGVALADFLHSKLN